MGTKVHLPTIDKRIKALKAFDSTVVAVAEILSGKILANWKRGTGSDDRKLSSLSESYKIYKGNKGRVAIRNLLFTGQLTQSLSIKRKKAMDYILGFTSDQLGKARGNADIIAKAGGAMLNPISDRIDKILQDFAFKRLTK